MILTSREWRLVALSALLLSLAMPPLPTAPLAWVGLVPLIMALEDTKPLRAALIGYIFGYLHQLGSLYWITFQVDMSRWLAIVSWLLAPLILAFWTAGAAFVFRAAAAKLKWAWVWALPFAWTGFEYLRYFSQLAFPWAILGNTQARLIGIIQQADLWGVLGVSFWVATLNVLAYYAVTNARTDHRASWRYAAAFAIVVGAAATYGRWRLSEPLTKPQTIRIALVQPNISMDTKWHSDNALEVCMDTLRDQTERIGRGKVDLVIWPETAIPDYVIYTPPGAPPGRRVINPRYITYFQEIMDSVGAPILSGVPARDYNTDREYNSAMLATPDSIYVQSYDKQLLVPFGERVPYKSVLGFLARLNVGIATWSPGTRFTVFKFAKGSFGLGICFESVFPAHMSRFVRDGADFLVVITNDAWFQRTSLIYQHEEFASFRAIENRVWVARAANTGISAFVDPWGRDVQTGPAFTQRTLIGTVGPRERDTLYLHWGDWIGWLSLVVAGVLAAAGFVAAMRRRT